VPVTWERPVSPAPSKRPTWKKPWLAPLVMGLVPPLVAAAVLAAVPAPRAQVRLDAEVSGFTVVLGSQANFAEDLEVARLGVSGLDRITVTAGSAGGVSSEADAVHLAAAEDSAERGRITLDLRPLLPAGAEVSLALGELPHSYVLKADSLEGLEVPVAGLVEVVIPGEVSERLNFGPSGAVTVHSAGRQMRLDFTPAHSAPSESGAVMMPPLVTNLAARGLTLSRVEQFVSGGHLTTRRVSTLLGGSLIVTGGDHWKLDPHQPLRLEPAGGAVTAALGAKYLSLRYDGEVSDVSVESESGSRSLKPSLLREATFERPGLVLAGLLTYLAILGIAVRSWSRRAG
jgi:hypothetical protein